MRPIAQRWSCTAILSALAVVGQQTTASAQQDEALFEGETIEVVYNTGPGGAVGLTAQLLAEHLGEHIPGNPEVVAVSMPGGALLRGIQFVYNADSDGLTLGWLAWGGSTRVLDKESLRVPFHEFSILGGLATQWVTQVRTDAQGGLEGPEYFADLEQITHGGISPTVSTDLRTAASMDLLGIDLDYVGGHTGGSDVLAALRRGEIEMRNSTTSNYLTTVVPELVDTGEVMGVYYWGQPSEDGETPSPVLDPLPTFYDYFVEARGEPPSGPAYDLVRYLTRTSDGLAWLFAAPPGTSEEKTEILAQAFAELVEDPDFVEGAKQVLSTEPEAVLRDEATEIVNEVRDVSPEIVETMRSYVDQLSR